VDDSTVYLDLMAENDVDHEVLLADRGYDSDPIREDVRSRGGTPEILVSVYMPAGALVTPMSLRLYKPRNSMLKDACGSRRDVFAKSRDRY
jgi:hypothetical protein